MPSSRPSPAGAVIRGLLAGAVGTGVMTAYQLAVAKARDSGSSDTPAQVGKRIIEGVLQRGPVTDDQMEALNNAMHVAYGTSWGVLYGLARSSAGTPAGRGGVSFGLFVWAASLVQLPAMKLAPPVWEQPPVEVALDASYHVVYGLAVATAYSALGG